MWEAHDNTIDWLCHSLLPPVTSTTTQLYLIANVRFHVEREIISSTHAHIAVPLSILITHMVVRWCMCCLDIFNQLRYPGEVLHQLIWWQQIVECGRSPWPQHFVSLWHGSSLMSINLCFCVLWSLIAPLNISVLFWKGHLSYWVFWKYSFESFVQCLHLIGHQAWWCWLVRWINFSPSNKVSIFVPRWTCFLRWLS